MSEPVRLNIGAGDSKIPGFIPIDAKFGHDAAKLDYATGTVDEVYASHVLEHIHHSQTLTVLMEWVRVLKPGGRIRIGVPDISKIVDMFKTGDMDLPNFSAWLHGGVNHDLDRHQAEFTEEHLFTLLQRCGITDISRFDPENEDWTKSPMSLNIQGFKRQVQIPREPRVAMVLSTPRIGFIDLFSGVSRTCRNLGWDYLDWGGTEWGRGLTHAIQEAIERFDPDYIMCLDYDSVFTEQDCKTLLDLMQKHPEVGALFPVEAHRHGDLMLGMNPKNGSVRYDKDITALPSGHFGCTIIRREVLDSLPQPWFMSFPNPETGQWNEGNLDADLNFWLLMGLHGWIAGQANNVVIGHMELCVKWPTNSGNGMMWQPIQHYKKKGKPSTAVFDCEFWNKRIASFNAGVSNGTNGVVNSGNVGNQSVPVQS